MAKLSRKQIDMLKARKAQAVGAMGNPSAMPQAAGYSPPSNSPVEDEQPIRSSKGKKKKKKAGTVGQMAGEE